MKRAAERITSGIPDIPGAVRAGNGFNFAVRVPDGIKAGLVIAHLDSGVDEEIPLPGEEASGEMRAVRVNGLSGGTFGYYYRLDGEKYLDPWAGAVRDGLCFPCPDRREEAVKSPDIRPEDLVIYKLHVRGFTRKARGKIRHRGTFRGLAEAVPYIAGMGFNAVELMPVYDWDETLKVRPYSAGHHPGDGGADARHNYWGYAENNRYLAPKETFVSGTDAVREVRDMIDAMHRAGILVFLEMYFPERSDPFTSLLAVRYWKTRYQADGFHLIGKGAPFEPAVRDPMLADTRLFFDQADAGYIYGNRMPVKKHIFSYNDTFLGTGRRLLKGDAGQIGDFVGLIRRNPARTGCVNYMANVNGFTLRDTVSYNEKHNEKNGEGGKDGPVWNWSWNSGTEGPTRKPLIRRLRLRQIKNALVYVFLAQGTPLLFAGDESGNTERGNNNGYASDDEDGWTDWSASKESREIREFTKKLIAFRVSHPVFHMPEELRGTDYRAYGYPDLSLHDTKAWVCSFAGETRSVGMMYDGRYDETGRSGSGLFYTAFNAFWEKHEFALPDPPKGAKWTLVLDTAAGPGEEFPEDGNLPEQKYFTAGPRSAAILATVPDVGGEAASTAQAAATGETGGSRPEAGQDQEAGAGTASPEAEA